MAGKFLTRDAIIDSVKSEHRTNAIRRRTGLTRHPIVGCSCGCPAPSCGAFYIIRTEQTIPTPEQCVEILARDKRMRNDARRRRAKLSPEARRWLLGDS
jgi:hypothetical protein